MDSRSAEGERGTGCKQYRPNAITLQKILSPLLHLSTLAFKNQIKSPLKNLESLLFPVA